MYPDGLAFWCLSMMQTGNWKGRINMRLRMATTFSLSLPCMEVR